MKGIEVNRVFVVITIIFFLFHGALTLAGCTPDQGSEDGVHVDELEEIDQHESEQLPLEDFVIVTDYYWPWANHGQVELSSGEVILAPDIFESDYGFIGEFTESDAYEGRLIWRVQESDVFSLEWISLEFDVDYYNQSEWESSSHFKFLIEGLSPEPADAGLQEFPINMREQQDDFEVVIKTLCLGKEEEGSFSTEPINYVAFDIEMRVIEKTD